MSRGSQAGPPTESIAHVRHEERARADKERVMSLVLKFCEGRVDLPAGVGGEHLNLQPMALNPQRQRGRGAQVQTSSVVEADRTLAVAIFSR